MRINTGRGNGSSLPSVFNRGIRDRDKPRSMCTRGNGSSLPRICLTVESGTGTSQWIEVMINPAWERGNDKPRGTGQGTSHSPYNRSLQMDGDGAGTSHSPYNRSLQMDGIGLRHCYTNDLLLLITLERGKDKRLSVLMPNRT
jgi:hypothetical protein